MKASLCNAFRRTSSKSEFPKLASPSVKNMITFWHMDVAPARTLASMISNALVIGARKFVLPLYQLRDRSSIQSFMASLFASVIGTKVPLPYSSETLLLKCMMVAKSFHVNVSKIAFVASLAKTCRSLIDMLPDVSTMMSTSLGPVAAAAYHGRMRGSNPFCRSGHMSILGHWVYDPVAWSAKYWYPTRAKLGSASFPATLR
mmetsp:Transcript_6619/g.19682  ORF Transcript_6619/g.19682 Transcript_6619/m.19682 type:complete len:202 (-) Transcript_6619:709-1314(-)